MEQIRYTTIETIQSLCKKLNLPKPHIYSQDWEDEVADSQRIEEFITCYQNEITDENEKFTLMIIIINSCNDALSNGNFNENYWKKIKDFLIKDYNIHKDTIDYWSVEDEEYDDCFVITPLMRKIKQQLIKP